MLLNFFYGNANYCTHARFTEGNAVCFFHSHKKFVKIILLHNKSDKVFKNGPSKIF